MIAPSSPFCPVSFGFFGLLGAIIARRGSLFNDPPVNQRDSTNEEEEDLLAVGEGECDQLTDDRITSFLETQKQQYYRSIGMAPPKQMKTIDSSTTPGASMIEFSSSRETSMLDDGEDSALITLDSRGPTPSPAFSPQTFRMDENSDRESLSQEDVASDPVADPTNFLGTSQPEPLPDAEPLLEPITEALPEVHEVPETLQDSSILEPPKDSVDTVEKSPDTDTPVATTVAVNGPTDVLETVTRAAPELLQSDGLIAESEAACEEETAQSCRSSMSNAEPDLEAYLSSYDEEARP